MTLSPGNQVFKSGCRSAHGVNLGDHTTIDSHAYVESFRQVAPRPAGAQYD